MDNHGTWRIRKKLRNSIGTRKYLDVLQNATSSFAVNIHCLIDQFSFSTDLYLCMHAIKELPSHIPVSPGGCDFVSGPGSSVTLPAACKFCSDWLILLHWNYARLFSNNQCWRWSWAQGFSRRVSFHAMYSLILLYCVFFCRNIYKIERKWWQPTCL